MGIGRQLILPTSAGINWSGRTSYPCCEYILAGAATSKCMVFGEQFFNDFRVQIFPCALMYRYLGPLESEIFELPKYGLGYARYAAGLVDIIDSNQPGPTGVERVCKTADSRDQRTKVKRSCWRRSKPTDVVDCSSRWSAGHGVQYSCSIHQDCSDKARRRGVSTLSGARVIYRFASAADSPSRLRK